MCRWETDLFKISKMSNETWSSCSSVHILLSQTLLLWLLNNWRTSWINKRSILCYLPVCILKCPLYEPHYPNVAALTHFYTTCILQALKEQAVALLLTHIPLKRIIYIGQVWDQSNLCGTTEYTNLRSDISLAEGTAGREHSWERQRIKHGAATAFDLPFPPFSLFQRTSEESSSWCRSWGPINLTPTGAPRWIARGLFIFIVVWCDSKKIKTFFGVLFHAG